MKVKKEQNNANQGLVETINTVVDVAERIPSSLSTQQLAAGIVLAAGVAASGFWADWMKGRSKFSQEDIVRHRALIGAYEDMGITKPDFWSLTTDNKPTFTLDYVTLKDEVDRVIRILDSHPSTANLSRIAILSLLSKYLESLQKRSKIKDTVTNSHERADGVEAMFLSEMISWLLTKFLALPDVGDNAMETMEKRLKYCKAVRVSVSQNNMADSTRANFKDMLIKLCHELAQYNNNLINQSKMVNYNSLVTDLSDQLLAYESTLFNMLYLLINDAYQDRLDVHKFTKPADSDVKEKKMINTVLGQWLLKTLATAGISEATYDATNHLNIQEIYQHLQGQHPYDNDCNLEREARNLKSETWGNWTFVTEKMPKSANQATSLITTEESFDSTSYEQIMPLLSTVSNQTMDPNKRSHRIALYLASIRDIHRAVLLICHLRQKIDRSKFVNGVFGQAWTYGDPAGKAALTELLCSVNDDIKLCEATINIFWNAYFSHYSEYAKIKREDSIEHLCYKRLNMIEARGVDRKKIVKCISALVKAIRDNATNIPDTVAKANQSLRTLYQDILLHMEFYNKTDCDNYRIMKSALDELQKKPLAILDASNDNLKEDSSVQPAKQATTEASQQTDCSLEPDSAMLLSTSSYGDSVIKNVSPTNVLEYEKSALNFYFKVDELLDFNRPIAEDSPLRQFMNYRLVPKSTDFRSSGIADIYAKYLVNNLYEVTHYWLAYFSFTSKIPVAKIKQFKEAYVRINAVFNLLYDLPEGDSQPMEIEMILATALLRSTIENDFWENQYFGCFPFQAMPLLTVKIKDDNPDVIQITLDKKWLELSNNVLCEENQHLKTVVQKQSDEIKALAAQRDDLEQKLRDKDVVIERKDAVIRQNDIDLRQKDLELARLSQQILAIETQRNQTTVEKPRKSKLSFY